MAKRALIIIDVQNDFCEGGSLAVPKGSEVVEIFNKIRNQKWDLIVLTQDWHPKDHVSFAINNPGAKLFTMHPLKDGSLQMMWPAHCVQNTDGAKFHPKLLITPKDVIVQKGKNKNVDSYSGFFDNNKAQQTELQQVLKTHGITDVYCGGLATDYCVQYTVKDAISCGFNAYFIENASRGIQQQTIDEAKVSMEKAGAIIINSEKISF